MKTKTMYVLTVLIGLTSLTFLTLASNPQYKECTHLYDGVLDGTYTIVPINQSCPAIPTGWHPTFDPSKPSSIKNHDLDDPLCVKSSQPIDF